MSLFRAGPNKSSNVYLGLVTVLMHFDRQQRFPWNDYVDVLIKAVMFELTVESSASSPSVPARPFFSSSRWRRCCWRSVSAVRARTGSPTVCIV